MADEASLPGASRGSARTKRFPMWLAPLLIAVGGAFVVVAFLFARSELRYGAEGIQTEATILLLWEEEHEDSEGDTSYSYHAGYEFVEPGSGRAYRGQGEVGVTRYLGLRTGDRIDVSYLASDPTDNRLGSPEPQLFLPMAIGAFGSLALVGAPLVFLSSVRERRMRRLIAARPPAVAGDLRRIDVFTRSPFHAAGGPVTIGAGLGALLVAGFGLSQVGNMPSLLMLTLFGSVIGVGFIALGITSLRRGFGLKVAEVGPDALWILGLGRIAWPDVAQAWIEEPRRARAASGSAEVATSPFARLGIVPRDEALVARRPDRLARALGRAFFGFTNQLRSSSPVVTLSDSSPFGVSASELDQPFDDLVESIRRFTTVGEREVRPMGSADDAVRTETPARSSTERLTEDELADLDRRRETRGGGLGS